MKANDTPEPERWTLRDKPPEGFGREAREIRRAASLWTPEAAAGFDSLEEALQWTHPSQPYDPRVGCR